MRLTSMPSTRAASVFCAHACMARPVTVRFRNACSPSTMRPASTSVPMSEYETLTPARSSCPSGNGLGNECGCASMPAFTVCLMPIERPSVAITSGITPCRMSGSTTIFLNPTPSSAMMTRHASRNAIQRGAPIPMKNRIENAGSITNSPCAKLIVPDACHSSVKPRAARAYMAPAAVPDTMSWTKSPMRASSGGPQPPRRPPSTRTRRGTRVRSPSFMRYRCAVSPELRHGAKLVRRRGAEAEELEVERNLLEQHVGADLDAAAALACRGEERRDRLLHDDLADERGRRKARRIHGQGIAVVHAERCRVHHDVEAGRITGPEPGIGGGIVLAQA